MADCIHILTRNNGGNAVRAGFIQFTGQARVQIGFHYRQYGALTEYGKIVRGRIGGTAKIAWRMDT